MTEGPNSGEFDTGRQYRRAGTSAEAAAGAAVTARLSDTHRAIWRALCAKPRTPDELVGKIKGQSGRPLCLNTIRARITELKNAGWALPTGEIRKTDAGRPADVMRALTKASKTT